MTDYSKMSDFEINKEVAIATAHSKLSSLGWQGSQGKDCNSVIVRGPHKIGAFDPCNDPADAWTIIVEHGISLYHDNGNWQAEMTYDAPVGAFGTDETCSKFVDDKNPLRAAMIVFLMMKETEQCSS